MCRRRRHSADVKIRSLVVSWLGLCLVSASAAQETPAAAAPVPFEVTGRVVTWDGQPIAGAHLVLAATDAVNVVEALQAAGPVSAADGSFTLTVPPKPAETPARALLVAAKGFASRLVDLPNERPAGADAKKPVDLAAVMLVPGQRIVGRVRDAAGQPIADATVTTQDMLAMLLQHEGVTWLCSARTNQSGIFDLPCALPAGSVLEVKADGFCTAVRKPVAAGTPLEIELQPSGFVQGQVQSDGGVAADRWLSVTYEADQELQLVRTDATGMFRIPLQHAGRWRLRVNPTEGDPRTATSALGDGPATGIVLALGKKSEAAAKKKLIVRATAKGSSEAVRTFRAVATWGEMAGNERPWLQSWLQGQLHAVKPCAGGSAEVDGPPEDGQGGVVLVVAEGFAPCLHGDVTWDAEHPTLTVELEPEASVRGIVRDAVTKQPLAGARVAAIAAGGYFGDPTSLDGDAAAPRSGADGSFRIGQLGEGEWLLQVAVEGRPALPPTNVTLQSGEARADVVFDVPVGARVAGKLVGAPLSPGMRVSLMPVPTGQAQPFGHFVVTGGDFGASPAPEGAKALGADGSFAFDGVALGHYTLLLHLPAPPRSGASLFLPVDSFRVREGGLQRDIDIAGDRTHAIRGRVRLTGASTPIENLLVVAQPDFGGQGFWGGGFDLAQGARSFLGRDGTFTLPVLAGSYRLQVLDLALGAVVAMGKPVVVKDADAQCDLDVQLVAVTIECKPHDGKAMALVDRIEVRCVLPGQREAGMAADFDDTYDLGRGVRLPRGTTTLTLALPPGEVTLLARNNAARLRTDDNGEPMPPLGKLDLPVPLEPQKPAVLEVAPPPEIPESPAEGGEKEHEKKRR